MSPRPERPSDAEYYERDRVELFSQGDVFRDVPLAYLLPADELVVDDAEGGGSRRFLSGPLEFGRRTAEGLRTIIERRRGKETQQIPKEEAIRRLGLDEKLHLVLPIVTGVDSIKGKKPWDAFVRLNEIRGEVVHYKPRGKTDDPDIASALGRLLKGEASTCVDDAASIILAYEPNALPESTKQALGL